MPDRKIADEPASILHIIDNRKPKALQVHPDLMGPASLGPALHQRAVSVLTVEDSPELGPGLLAALAHAEQSLLI